MTVPMTWELLLSSRQMSGEPTFPYTIRNSRASGNRRLKQPVYLLSLVAMILVSDPLFAEHILIAREEMLEAAHPNAIAPAPDGGYVIAGYADYSAWATKVDESGKVIWRHELTGSTASPGGGGTEYRGITFLRVLGWINGRR